MAPEKVTEMVLNVDLKCAGCYKKVKKVIGKMPQIRDQVFDVDKNKVKVMVVCCSPEKIRDKLCYKGGGAIQSIEIVEKADKPKESDQKPKATDQVKPPPAKAPDATKPAKASDVAKPPAEKAKPAAEKPKDAEKAAKPAEKPKEAEKLKPADKPKDSGKPPEAEKAKPKDVEKPKDAPKKADAGPGPGPSPDVAKMVYEPVQGYPQMYPPAAYPLVGYGQYYDQGYGGAPYQHGYGMTVVPPPPPPSYGGFGYEYGYNGNRSHYNASNDYRGEEEGEGCRIM